MAIRLNQTLRLGASLAALAFLANCSPPPPVDMPAAPPRHDNGDTRSVPNSARDDSGLLGGPVSGPDGVSSAPYGPIRSKRADGVLVVTNRPIANPGETAFGAHSSRNYAPDPGRRMAPERQAHAAPHRGMAPARQSHVMAHAPSNPHAAPAVARPAQPHPAPAPASPKPAARVAAPLPVAKPAPVPQVAAKPVLPAKPVVVPPAVKLQAPKVEAPKVDAAKVAAAAAQAVRMIPALASTDPRLAGLQSDVLPALTEGARFTVDPGIAKGQAGPVTLTLPPGLFSQIRAKAAQHGLDRFAQQTSVTATLTGTGYEVIPASPLTNELAKDTASVFTWQVTPQPVARTPLHVDLSASLTGGSETLSLPLAGLEPAGGASSAETPDLSGRKAFTLPGLSEKASKSVVAAGLAMMGLIFLAIAARRRGENRREDERRRRQRDAMMFGAPMPVEDPAPPAAPAPAPPSPAPAAPPIVAGGDGRSIVQVIAEAVSDLRDGDGKEPPKK